MPRDSDLQADWIGFPPDYWDNEEETEYESRRDMELENELH